jgi:hypothetical protein
MNRQDKKHLTGDFDCLIIEDFRNIVCCYRLHQQLIFVVFHLFHKQMHSKMVTFKVKFGKSEPGDDEQKFTARRMETLDQGPAPCLAADGGKER